VILDSLDHRVRQLLGFLPAKSMRLERSLELSHPKAFFCVMALLFSSCTPVMVREFVNSFWWLVRGRGRDRQDIIRLSRGRQQRSRLSVHIHAAGDPSKSRLPQSWLLVKPHEETPGEISDDWHLDFHLMICGNARRRL
jgi:hypothetical protein